MTDIASPAQEGRRFRAVLHPHRSLGPKGFLALMIVFGAVSFAAGIAFLSIGAWPVFGFFGLDVALLFLAFKLNYRAARAFEVVELDEAELAVTRVAVSGEERRFTFNPYWVRVDLSEMTDGRTSLALTSHGQSFSVGHVLTDDERRDFARVLAGALAAIRGQRPALA